MGFLAVKTKYNPAKTHGILSHCPVDSNPKSLSKPPWLSFKNSTKKRTVNKRTRNNPNKNPDFPLASVFQYIKNKIAKTNI